MPTVGPAADWPSWQHTPRARSGTARAPSASRAAYLRGRYTFVTPRSPRLGDRHACVTLRRIGCAVFYSRHVEGGEAAGVLHLCHVE
eukprot:5683670-Pyramimonas_sp.AAC.1